MTCDVPCHELMQISRNISYTEIDDSNAFTAKVDAYNNEAQEHGG